MGTVGTVGTPCKRALEADLQGFLCSHKKNKLWELWELMYFFDNPQTCITCKKMHKHTLLTKDKYVYFALQLKSERLA